MTHPTRSKKSLAERKAELQARLSQIEARERDARRKEATRVRVVLGAMLLSRATTLVQQRDEKARSFLRFLRDLAHDVTRQADAPAKAAIERLIDDLESELVKPRLAEQPSVSATSKPDQLAQDSQRPLQRLQEAPQPSPTPQPSQMAQRPLQGLQEPAQSRLGTWPKPNTSS